MKEKLKNSMKPAPERFRYSVQAAIDEAITQKTPTKKRLSIGWRIVIAVALIAVLLPSAVFGASKLFELTANPVDSYGLKLNVERETEADYPQYVKMHIEIPEGFAVVPNTEELKYCKSDNENTFDSGFSVLPMRYDNADQTAYIANVSSYEECIVGGHQAYHVAVNNIKGAWEQLYVYFEDVNVMLLIYHNDVTDEQLSDFVSGIRFTEGTAADHTILNEPYDERQISEAPYKYDETFVEMASDTVLTFKHYSQVTDDESLRCTAQITDVRVTDSIDGLDESCFNEGYPLNTIADSGGKLTPKEFTVFKEGDGFTSTYEELSRENKEQKLILAEITYTNLSDEDVELYIPYCMCVLNKSSDNSFTRAENIDPENDILSTPCCDTELTYLSPHGEGKSYYILTLPANETMTVTVGVRCNADMLEKSYLSINDISEIVDPVYEGNGDYTTYLFKVTDDDR